MTRPMTFALLSLFTPACLINSVTPLEPEAESVQLVSETDRPNDCRFLGKIAGRSHADDSKLARQGAENDLRNKAAALKGNFAVYENIGGGRVGTTSQQDVVMNGKAYACKTLDMQLAEEEKRQQAIQEKEEREAKAEAERQAKLEEAKAKAEEAKAKREQEEKERDERAEAERKEKKSKKNSGPDW